MATHGDRHEEILERVVTGELSPDAEEVTELTTSCPECRERLSVFGSMVARLDAAGELQEEILQAAEAIDSPPGLVEVRTELERRASTRSSWGVPFPALAAAAVVVVAIVTWAILVGIHSPPHSETYIGASLTPVYPAKEPSSYAEFRWTDDEGLDTGGYYVVIIYPDEEAAVEVDRSPQLEEPTWRPEKSRAAGWPARIRWEVRAFMMDDARRDRCSSSSWRGD